ncbi:response regulator, partial [Klebsiella pneumoniae]|nr:response regulator [Klebsiella pneumoniae]
MEKYIYFMCNKDVTLVLTDDYYFYFGLKQLTGLPLVYITYEGSMDKPIVIKQKRNIRVLVDSRIFYSGKWDGYKMLRKTLNMISQWMWLDISGGGGGGGKVFPKGGDYEFYVNMGGNLKKRLKR